jgi:acetyl-CoA synthetase
MATLAKPAAIRIIEKRLAPSETSPNLADYGTTRAAFSWGGARAELAGLPSGGINIAHEAVDRHAAGPRATHAAIRWLGRSGARRELTYGDLARESNRFANVLASLGVGKGDAVFVLADRVPEVYIAALGTWKNGSVFSPLFSAFGPEPIRMRLTLGHGAVLVTTPALYRKKVAPIRASLTELRHVLLVGAAAGDPLPDGTKNLASRMAETDEHFTICDTGDDDVATLHFTSGTTGVPKGAVHVHAAVVAHHITGKLALDFHDDDVFWCTADPGWVTGTSYGIIAPLTNGITSVVDEGDFDPARWYEILEREKVTVWYTAPTAIRMLMKAGAALAKARDLSALRFIASVGEPLNAEAVWWGNDTFGIPIHDNWWQTETGGIMIANFRAMDIRPGSMGRALPGVDAAIVRRSDGGDPVEQPDGTEGELALRPGWPSMFRGYLGDEERYRHCFAGPWYLTGDLARRDQDGYFWFVGRGDDVIKSSGHLIGPFEVESSLLEHPAVAEAAVIGKPDPVAGEIVKAFVSLKDGFAASDSLRLDLLGFARKRLGAAVAPKEIAFQDALPRTRSGKIMRRLLRARELGLPQGDLSTLEVAVPESGQAPSPADSGESHEIHLLRKMLRVRRFEERCAELYKEEKIRGFLHLYIGEEAVAVGVLQTLTAEDAIVATYREHGHALVRGVSARAIMAEMYGKREGCSGGRGGSMHLFDAATRFFGGNAIVGGGLPLAAGLALADTLQHRDRVTTCFFGDGAVAEGEFHETLNLAALWKLPVLFCCENNLYAMGTAVDRAQSETNLALKAAAYRIPSWDVDGMDVEAVERASRRAVTAIRAGQGPHFLELRTYRFRPHSMFDPDLYRPKTEIDEWKKRCPIACYTDALRKRGLLDDGQLAAIEADVATEIADAVAFAESGGWEPVDTLTKHVYSETSTRVAT